MREGLPTLTVAVAAFLDDVAIAYSPLTRTTYATRLRCLTEADWPLTAQICRRLIRMELEIHARSTVRNFCGVLSAFGKFCVEQGWLAENPMKGIPLPKAQYKPHRWLTRDEFSRLWDGAVILDQRVHRGPKGVSYRLMLTLLSLGLRVGEACSVRAEDVSHGLLLVKGKGAKYRYVPCPEGLPPAGRLLPVKPRRVQTMLDTLSRETGIPHLHPHLLRASWASLALLSNEQDFAAVQAVGGWATPSMLNHYSRSVFQQAAARRLAGLKILPDMPSEAHRAPSAPDSPQSRDSA